jgi:TetR/AcrR family transcriptional regulator, tetracycline repressor protein
MTQQVDGAIRRGPGVRAGLTRAVVVAAARRIADDEGLDALTLRRLARETGVTPNTIYSHVADKSALLDLLMDDVAGEVEAPDPASGDWRESLRALFVSTRRTVAASPQLAPLFLARAARGPNAIYLGEVTLALLARGGVEGPAAVRALRALLIFSFGYAAFEAARVQEADPRARAHRGAQAFAADDSPPRIRTVAAELAGAPGDAGFDEGLDALIVGLTSAASGIRAAPGPKGA